MVQTLRQASFCPRAYGRPLRECGDFFTGYVVLGGVRAHGQSMKSSPESSVPPPGDPVTLRELQAALAIAPAGAVFSGKTAAWLHGLPMDPCNPIEMTVPVVPARQRRRPSGGQTRHRRRLCQKGGLLELRFPPITR